jgi:hypothetical protein
MATFALIHGAGDVGWYWHLVEQELRQRGYDTLAPDLPCLDDAAGLAEYADNVLKVKAGERPILTAAQVFELAERVGRRLVGNIRGLPADSYRLR